MPFIKDRVEGRYERSVDQVFQAARDVVKKNGVRRIHPIFRQTLTNQHRGDWKSSVIHSDRIVDAPMLVENALVGKAHPIHSPTERTPGVIGSEAKPSLVEQNVRSQGHVIRCHMNPVGCDQLREHLALINPTRRKFHPVPHQPDGIVPDNLASVPAKNHGPVALFHRTMV